VVLQTDFPLVLEDIVLAIVTLNLLRPSVSLISLFMDHFSTRRRALEIKIAKTVMGGYTYISSLITMFRESGGSPTA